MLFPEQARMACEISQRDAEAQAFRRQKLTAVRLERRAARQAARATRAARRADRAATRAGLAWAQLG